MNLTVPTGPYVLAVSAELTSILEEEVSARTQDRATDRAIEAVTLNFRDPGYSPETGGYHPVEVRLSVDGGEGRLEYITDFAYFGQGPFVELDKEIDFDFIAGRCISSYLPPCPLADVIELFEAWQQNFIAYYRMGVFNVSVTVEV